MTKGMKNLLKVSVMALLVIAFSCGASLAETGGMNLKAPANMKEAYNMMQAAYKACMQSVSDFNEGKITGGDMDDKLKIYTYYKQQYEKFAKAGEQQQVSAGEAKPATGVQAAETAAPAVSVSDPKLQKKLDELLKYAPEISAAPKITGGIGKFFRNLFGSHTIADVLSDGYLEFQKGNYAAASAKFEQARAKDPKNKNILYYLALSKIKEGKSAEAEPIISSMHSQLKDEKWNSVFRSFTDPWVEANVAFKIGGFDSLDQYKQKIAAGNRKELHGDEYYEKYVNPRTYQYYSTAARKEFESIAGIDCGGFVQRVYMDMCEKNGIKPPFNYKVPGRQLQNYGTQLKDDGIIPPMTAKPGDFILLKEHDGWGHAFYFAGRDKNGTPLIVEASGEGKVLARPMPDRYYQWYQGTYKFKDMDKIREKMSLPN